MTVKRHNTPLKRMGRAIIGTFASLIVGLCALAVFSIVSTSFFDVPIIETAQAQSNATNPNSEFWRMARSGEAGYTTSKSPEAGVLINSSGEAWQERQRNVIPKVIGWFIVVTLAALLLFLLIRGRMRLDGDADNGSRVFRWSSFERLLHWVQAICFIILMITGLWLMMGRSIFAPVIGMEAVAAGAKASISLHNLVGPILAVTILLSIIMWFKDNLPKAHDIDWFKKGGGFGKEHPDAGRMNGGEKLFFWILATLGVAVCVTGLMMAFHLVADDRATSQNIIALHSILSGLWMCVVFGHIYIGTVGTEGALEGMTSGTVSEAWAKQHHNLWYEDQKRNGLVGTEDAIAAAKRKSPAKEAEA